VIDIPEPVTLEKFFRQAADVISQRLKMTSSALFDLLVAREKETSTVLNPHLAIPHIIIDGDNIFEILLARAQKGIRFSDEYPNVQTVFLLVGTRDERNFHLRALSAIAQVVQSPDFEKKWLTAKNEQELRDIILLGTRRREQNPGLSSIDRRD
jgi:APA family basic amino acid/polyamine antiporter